MKNTVLRAVTIAALAFLLCLSMLGAFAVAGPNGPTTVVGTSADEVLAGGRGPDVIRGKGGDDALWGGRGPDILNGGPGFDRCHSRGRGSNDVFLSCERI